MKEMTFEQLKEAELGILDYIDSICKENNYSYYLAYGTLLGAVRHHGFIPWDDDIDILIARKDYAHFIKTISEKGGRYKIISAYNNHDYRLPFIKVVDSETVIVGKASTYVRDMGVFVDVFPLVSLPSNYRERTKIKNKAWMLRQVMDHASIWERGHINRSIAYKAACYLCHCYGWRRAFNQFEKLADKSSVFEKSGFYVDLAGSISRRNEWGKACFEEKCFLLFEGKRYPAPYNYDEVLKEYGDYMTPPPMEKRVSEHAFKAYYKDNNS